MEKKKIHKLSVSRKQDFFLVAVSSHENDYRVSWSINNSLNLKLTRSDNLKIYNDRLKEEQEFSNFSYDDTELYIRYNLISNRCSNGFLLHEYKNIDFFLQLTGELAENQINDIVSKLKQIDIITTAFLVRELSPKSLQKFLS